VWKAGVICCFCVNLVFQEQLARSDARCLETKQALDSKSIEIHLMKERVRRIEGQLAESEEEGTRLQEKILILEEEVSKLQADNMELQLQLELERNNVGGVHLCYGCFHK
jgi:septal ring factor EnvC (AmiA/AmiB activator)